MTKSASRALEEARALIDVPDRWCQFTFEIDSPEKQAFCAYGALNKVCTGDSDNPPVYVAQLGHAEFYLREAANCEWGIDADGVNDRFDHRAVMTMYDIAISMAMSDEAAK